MSATVLSSLTPVRDSRVRACGVGATETRERACVERFNTKPVELLRRCDRGGRLGAGSLGAADAGGLLLLVLGTRRTLGVSEPDSEGARLYTPSAPPNNPRG